MGVEGGLKTAEKLRGKAGRLPTLTPPSKVTQLRFLDMYELIKLSNKTELVESSMSAVLI